MLHLKIITPQKIVMQAEILSATVPSAEGELTILPKHMNLFSLLKEGVVKIRKPDKEDFLAIGGGYLETDGEEIHILVSRAYGQDEIDQERTQKALEEAKNLLATTKDAQQRKTAISLLRRSVIDMKLLKKRRHIQSSV